jgi:predicted house-cleaning noncanonical NTP pyrophosphatase (MazG superfamily)
MSKKSDSNSLDTLLKTAPIIMEQLKIDPQHLVPNQFSTLFELSDLNQKATSIADEFAKNLESGIAYWSKSFLTNINSSDLEEKDKIKATSIFDENLLKVATQITDTIYKDLQSGKGMLFNSMLSDNVLTAMKGLLSFKKEVDSNFSGLSDSILSAAKMAITGIVCAYSPSLGIILKTTKILDKATDFLKTENLENTVTNLKEGIDKIKKDKELSRLQEIGTEISNLAEQTNISPDRIQKIGLNIETLKMINSEIIKAPSANTKEVIKKIGSHAAKTFPHSKEDIGENLNEIREVFSKNLRDKLPPEMVTIIESKIDKKLIKANEIMEACLDSKATFFDKVAAQQDAARMILSSVDDIKKLVTQEPEKDKIISDLLSKIQKATTGKITGGGISGIQDSLKLLPPSVTKSLKEALGSNFANEVAIKRGEEKISNTISHFKSGH